MRIATRLHFPVSVFLALLALPALADPSPAAAREPAYVPLFAALLERHTQALPSTVGTAVDYAALKRESSEAWQALLRELATAPPPRDRNETLAFWINAYNVLAIDVVLRSHPIESIRDAGSFLRPVWKREAGTVAGRAVSLDEIEHGILRKLSEPRIHAAIVCASTSCPSLRQSPFTADGLDAELDLAMRSWLASPTKGLRVDRPANRITVSRIFDWFEEDFAPLGGVRAVVARYAPESERAWLARHAEGARLDYFDYDWTLNEVR
jgi:hypothetical protein